MKKKKSIKPSDEGWVQDVVCPMPGQIICFRARKLDVDCDHINVFHYEPVCFFYGTVESQLDDELNVHIQRSIAEGCICETEFLAIIVASRKVVDLDRSVRRKSDQEPHVRIELLAYARIPESELVPDTYQLVNISFSVFKHQMPLRSPFDVVC